MSQINQNGVQRVTFQGVEGAYSEIVSRRLFPQAEIVPCPRFADCCQQVRDGAADRAILPVENARAGRVAGIHDILPSSELRVVGEEYQEVRHALLGVAGTSLESIKRVHSHEQALSQCRLFIEQQGWEPRVHADTAGAARDLAALKNVEDAALASPLAARAYGLEILAANVQDEEENTTRFLILAREGLEYDPQVKDWITSLIFRVRSVPAALYKALGGFATNGVNITKLESYICDSKFRVAQFYADVEGNPNDESVRLALEELAFYSKEVKILGSYPAADFRRTGKASPLGD